VGSRTNLDALEEKKKFLAAAAASAAAGKQTMIN